MTYDEREPRDLPEEDAETHSAEASEPASDPIPTEPADAPTEPIEPVQAMEPIQRPADESAPAEIESWPSQDPSATEVDLTQPTSAEPDWRSEPEAAAWPTEPPAAGSGGEGAWPTSAPERGDEPVLEPTNPAPDPLEEAPPAEPPPSEVEAYPAAAAAASTAPVAAAHAVPAAESQVGESTQCPRCGTENRPGLAFCRNCGQRLVAAGVSTTVERPGTPEGTQACPRCGTHNRAGVAFCQNCGANLRGTAEGYVPPAVAGEEAAVTATGRRGAVLGPVVLLIGLAGIITGYLLPFAYGSGSLFERAWGSGGYGVGFWSAYPDGAGIADQAYFGLAAAVPILGLLLLVLAVAGFMRAAPGRLQAIGLVIALLWSVGLVILFVVVELAANFGGDIVGMLRDLTPGGIIFFLAGLIVVIGTLTRFGRS
ncbi:MAG: zinc-ribbon domain-containing protein [Chloroflexota bacterium]|nr:zinc-ribbon domain-containing protein [Chloroflexota bacterium]